MTGEEVTITFGPLQGTGTPPQWQFLIREPDGSIAGHMAGPRILVLESLARWVALFEESSRPSPVSQGFEA